MTYFMEQEFYIQTIQLQFRFYSESLIAKIRKLNSIISSNTTETRTCADESQMWVVFDFYWRRKPHLFPRHRKRINLNQGVFFLRAIIYQNSRSATPKKHTECFRKLFFFSVYFDGKNKVITLCKWNLLFIKYC